MTIVSTKLSSTIFGNKKIVYGKSVISGDTNTGAVTLSTMGLKIVDWFQGYAKGTTEPIFVNEDMPCTADITITNTANNQTSYWKAEGIPG